MTLKQNLEAAEKDCNSISDFVSLAEQVIQQLDDHDWAVELLQKAGDRANSHLELCWLGFYANQWTEHELAHKLYLLQLKNVKTLNIMLNLSASYAVSGNPKVYNESFMRKVREVSRNRYRFYAGQKVSCTNFQT